MEPTLLICLKRSDTELTVLSSFIQKAGHIGSAFAINDFVEKLSNYPMNCSADEDSDGLPVCSCIADDMRKP